MVPFFYIWQMLVAGLMLAHASVLDVRRGREVGDKVFVAYSCLGLSGVGYSVLMGGYGWRLDFLSLAVAVTVPLAWLPYYFRMYAGADVKALISVALILPTYHSAYPQLYPFTSIMVLTNSLLFSAVVTVPLLVARRRNVKVPFLPFILLGYIATLIYGDITTFITN